jgi:hypothetical protein
LILTFTGFPSHSVPFTGFPVHTVLSTRFPSAAVLYCVSIWNWLSQGFLLILHLSNSQGFLLILWFLHGFLLILTFTEFPSHPVILPDFYLMLWFRKVSFC